MGAFVGTFGPRIADDLQTCTRPEFQVRWHHKDIAYAPTNNWAHPICLFTAPGS